MDTIMVLVDLQKTFDTLDHGVLLEGVRYLVFGHAYLNGLSPIFQAKRFWFLLIMLFLRLKH